MADSPLDYAVGTDGCVSAVPIALWSLHGHHRDDAAKKEHDGFGFHLDFKPVVGAYVACARIASGAASQPIDRARELYFGRTNARGWLLRREREALLAEAEDEIPEHPWEPVEPEAAGPWADFVRWLFGDDPVLFSLGDDNCADPTMLAGLPGEHYRIFYTFDRDLFEEFASQVMSEDPNTVLTRWGAARISITPFGEPTWFPELGLLDDAQRTRVTRLLFPGDRRGYHWGKHFDSHRTAAIFDVTPHSLRSLYASEWLQAACERLVQDDWPYLHALLGLINTAESGGPIPDLAKQLPSEVGPVGEAVRELRQYLYTLARVGWRDYDDVRTLAHVTVSHEAWRTAADKAKAHLGPVVIINGQPESPPTHPGTNDTHFSRLVSVSESVDYVEAIVAYFYMYAAGFDEAPRREVIEEHWESVQQALAMVERQRKAALEETTHPDLLRDLGLFTPGRSHAEYEARKDLVDRYHAQCAMLGVRFWEAADVQLSAQSDWDRHKPFVKWLGADTKLIAELTAPLFTHYLTRYQRLEQASVERFVRYFYRYHLNLGGHPVERTLPRSSGTVRIEMNPSTGRLTAQLYGGHGKARLLGEFEMLTELATAPEDEIHAPLGQADRGTAVKRLRRAVEKGQVREFQVLERPLDVAVADEVRGYAHALNTAAELVAAAAALATLLQEVEKQHGELKKVEWAQYMDAVQSSVALLSSAGPTLASVFKAAEVETTGLAESRFVRYAGKATKLTGAVGAVRDMIDGGTTVAAILAPERSSSDFAMYLDRGQSLPALLEGTRGVMQLAVGAGGAAELLLAGTATAAASSLGIWLAVGGVAVATLEVSVYVATGGGSRVDGFLAGVRDSINSQFKKDGERILGPLEDYEHKSPGNSAPETRKAQCKLAKQVGSLNELAKARSRGLPG